MVRGTDSTSYDHDTNRQGFERIVLPHGQRFRLRL